MRRGTLRPNGARVKWLSLTMARDRATSLSGAPVDDALWRVVHLHVGEGHQRADDRELDLAAVGVAGDHQVHRSRRAGHLGDPVRSVGEGEADGRRRRPRQLGQRGASLPAATEAETGDAHGPVPRAPFDRPRCESRY